MAALSFSVARGATENVFAAGSQSVTPGTNAPAAGDVEVRISDAGLTAGITEREVTELVGTIMRYIQDPFRNSSVFPNI